jgi:hypothetical protein
MQPLEYSGWLSLYVLGAVSVDYQKYMGHEMSHKIHEYEIEQALKPGPPPRKEMDYGFNFE